VSAESSPPVDPGEARLLNVGLLSAFYSALLCLMGVLEQSLFNKSPQK